MSQIETEVRRPSEAFAAALAEVLGFDPAFFTQSSEIGISEGACSFRRRMMATVGLRRKALAHAALFVAVARQLEEYVEFPPVDLPRLPPPATEDVEQAAAECRVHWRLPLTSPAPNMVRVLERAGVLVVRFRIGTERIDAFSYRATRPVVVLASDKGSASRQRFDAAHELAHLVFHPPEGGGTLAEERQADRFAGAFLLPRETLYRELPRGGTVELSDIFALKRRWNASAATIVMRGFEVGLVGPASYRRLFKRLRSMGWHRSEPDEPIHEDPEAVPTAFAVATECFGVSPATIAADLGLQPEVVLQVAGLSPAFLPASTYAPDVIRLSEVRKRRADKVPST